MPRYRVTERRAFKEITIIDADSVTAAERGEGEIVSQFSDESWADALLDVVEIGPDDDE